jgi:C1A family cysteine protease
MLGFYKKAFDRKTGEQYGTGWLPPYPDLRDYTERDADIPKMAGKLGITSGLKVESLPSSVDLREWFSPVEDQLNLGSCTAHAAVGIVEYFQNRAFDKYINGSRLYVYKMTRNLMGVTGDTGAWLRNTMGALALCGVPPERYWPYTDSASEFDLDPSPFLCSVAAKYGAVDYFCHDPLGADMPAGEVLFSVKKYLAAGIPSMFGFYGFPSFTAADVKGGIPIPCSGERAEWGHAIVAAGYDDAMEIKNSRCGKVTKGALLIRNSWGEGWGAEGYGWLPYDYIRHGLATDFWSLIKMDWIDTDKFGIEV